MLTGVSWLFCPIGAEQSGELRVCPEGIILSLSIQSGETPHSGLEDLVSLVLPLAKLCQGSRQLGAPPCSSLPPPWRHPVIGSAPSAPAQVQRERCEGSPMAGGCPAALPAGSQASPDTGGCAGHTGRWAGTRGRSTGLRPLPWSPWRAVMGGRTSRLGDALWDLASD